MDFKSLARRVFTLVRIPADIIMSALAVPAALVLLFYRRIGSARFPLATRCLKKIGLLPIRNHYYEPFIPELKTPLSQDRFLPGIDLNLSGQLEFLKQLTSAPELAALALDRSGGRFHIHNGSFESGDAEYLYQFLRAVKPAKLVEIGSGNSTKIARLALEKNQQETGRAARHICIEPYEQPWLENVSGIELIRHRVEECDVDWAHELAPGDLLFIDSSHVIRPQGDVLKEYLEILPQLASGVYVHIHDIFTPRDYLSSILIKDARLWNEQYLLEALLSGSKRYEILGALNFLHHHY